jgi:hypothetical protein
LCRCDFEAFVVEAAKQQRWLFGIVFGHSELATVAIHAVLFV